MSKAAVQVCAQAALLLQAGDTRGGFPVWFIPSSAIRYRTSFSMGNSALLVMNKDFRTDTVMCAKLHTYLLCKACSIVADFEF